jgi:hypothetical protein
MGRNTEAEGNYDLGSFHQLPNTDEEPRREGAGAIEKAVAGTLAQHCFFSILTSQNRSFMLDPA